MTKAFRTRAAVLAALLAPAAALADGSGESVFADNCAACHQPNGVGVPGAFPALAGNKFVQGAPAPLISTILNGRGGMPAFKSELTDLQLAQVVSYIRGGWGNKAAVVTPAQVTGVRNSTKAIPVQQGLQAH